MFEPAENLNLEDRAGVLNCYCCAPTTSRCAGPPTFSWFNTYHDPAGAGRAGADDDVVELAAILQAPIVHVSRGKEHTEYENPYDVGMTGLLGFASGYKAIREADVR